MSASHTRLFEDVFEVDFNCAGTNTQFLGDFPILEALLDQFHDLMFAGRKVCSDLRIHAGGFPENGVLHPTAAL